MRRILHCHWLTSGQDGAMSRMKIVFFSHVIHHLFTELVRSRELDIDFVVICVFTDLDYVSVPKHAEKANIQPS